MLCLYVVLPAQAQNALLLMTPANGTVAPNGTSEWTFNAQSGAVFSFTVETDSPEFDPALTLTDSGGRAIISSDDYNYPDSLLPLFEAITIPRTDTYTLIVSGFNGTSGDYILTMLPGYSILAHTDDLSDSQWRPLDAALVVDQADNQLAAAISGVRRIGVAFDDGGDNFADFYAQVEVIGVRNPSGWVVGMAFRRQGDEYYLLSINQQGTWRFSLMSAGQEQVIRDWTPHPNIVPGATSFSLGVLAKDVGFDFFYNMGYIGSASDSTLTEAGQIGLVLGTNSSLGGESTAAFADLVVTLPTEVNGAYIIPQQVLSGDGTAMVQALRRYHVISASGEMSLTLDESSVEFARPGINRLMLGRGTRYTNFAMGTTVNLSPATSGPAGCGLVFRFVDETNYTLAYFDQDGEYGMSQRSGDTFLPGLYGTNQALGAGQHHLLIIANDNKIYYYIDRELVGSLENTPQNGEIGTAVVNFEGNTTSCRYTNFWLWQWD